MYEDHEPESTPGSTFEADKAVVPASADVTKYNQHPLAELNEKESPEPPGGKLPGKLDMSRYPSPPGDGPRYSLVGRTKAAASAATKIASEVTEKSPRLRTISTDDARRSDLESVVGEKGMGEQTLKPTTTALFDKREHVGSSRGSPRGVSGTQPDWLRELKVSPSSLRPSKPLSPLRLIGFTCSDAAPTPSKYKFKPCCSSDMRARQPTLQALTNTRVHTHTHMHINTRTHTRLTCRRKTSFVAPPSSRLQLKVLIQHCIPQMASTR